MYICPKLLIKKIPKMKKLIYLFAAVIMFAFIACGGAETATEQAAPAAVLGAGIVGALALPGNIVL